MEIRILNSLEDAEKYRGIRLESLKNIPEAFASSYEEERDFSIEEFKTNFNRRPLLLTELLKGRTGWNHYFI